MEGKNNMKKEISYYWYHHMMPVAEKKIISDIIKNHNFEKFIELYKKYNSKGLMNGKILDIEKDGDIVFYPIIYFPDVASIYDKKTNTIEYINILEKNNFMKIDYEECKCG